MALNGAELVIEALKAEGVEVVFGFPGGVVIPIFDRLYGEESLWVVLARHEQGAVHAADEDAELAQRIYEAAPDITYGGSRPGAGRPRRPQRKEHHDAQEEDQ